LILNYDKFSQEESPNLILNLIKQTVDFIILDEIHFTKIRFEEELSKRRHNLDGLLTAVRPACLYHIIPFFRGDQKLKVISQIEVP
jgi:hypothetical protein